MAKKVIQRIDGILKQIKRIKKETNGISYNDFESHIMLAEAVCFSIFQVGERMNKLEELLGDTYPNLPWKEARRMRNVIAHDYDSVDFEKVYLTATQDIPVLEKELLNIKDDINQTRINSLSTERLILRPWNDFDADELFELAREPEIGYWCGWKAHEHIRDSFFALHNFLEVKESYAICLKDTNELIGSISLMFNTDLATNDDESELGYWIGKPFWNKGYITEAAKEVIRHAFIDLNISALWCARYDGNEKSKRVQEKLGFKFYNTSDDVEIIQLNEIRISHASILTKQDWLKMNAPLKNIDDA